MNPSAVRDRVLHALRCGPLTVAELGEWLGFEADALVHVLVRLEARGLACKQGWVATGWVLTEPGRALLRRMYAAHRAGRPFCAHAAGKALA
jgi:predicted transcriptional regulator